MKHLIAATSVLLALQSAPVFAGQVTEFETEFSDMYASYRASLFATNSGNAEAAGKALGSLGTKWEALRAAYATTPPPQYQDDAQWADTIAEVEGYVSKAKDEATAGDLSASHITLEGVRDTFGDLHARNGIETFSDRMNAYHAKMEHILGMDLNDTRTVLEQAAVLSYLADDVLGIPPAGAADNADYQALGAAFRASVDGFLAAARAGDADAIKAAAGTLKVPYSKFFLKFG
jgi:soluble cytochrome b562